MHPDEGPHQIICIHGGLVLIRTWKVWSASASNANRLDTPLFKLHYTLGSSLADLGSVYTLTLQDHSLD